MMRSATLSPCRTYRYVLSRVWKSSLPPVIFVGINPSTADEREDDPTIRKCVGFAQRWGFGSIVMLNLFAYRSTDPRGLLDVEDPVGPQNDNHLAHEIRGPEVGSVFVAWGNVHPSLEEMARHRLTRLLLASLSAKQELFCLGTNQNGSPRHPLYLPWSTPPLRWSPP